MTVFIYALCEPGTPDVRYVGKCSDPKLRIRQHQAEARRADRRCHRCNWLRSLNGTRPSLVILEEVSEQHWKERETFWIAKYRAEGARLTNTTAGGEGLVNPPPEVRAKIGAAQVGNRNCVGRVMSDETRRLIGAANKGRKHSEEARSRMSLAQTGRAHSEETRAKISAANQGKGPSRETIEKARRSNIGRGLSDEHKKKLSLARRGKPKSDAHRAAIAAALRRAKPNVWHNAICAQFHLAKTALSLDQIWTGMVDVGFLPAKRNALRPCITALVQMKKLARVSRATYVLLEEAG